MATTIDNATLTITINEDVKLNGQQVGSKSVQTLSGINEASRRIFSVPLHEVQIMALSSSAAAGTYETSSLKYMRITNMDSTNFVRLSFMSGSLNRFDTKLPAKMSAIFSSPSISGSSAGSAFDSFSNLTSIKAVADTAVVDVEMFVACT